MTDTTNDTSTINLRQKGMFDSERAYLYWHLDDRRWQLRNITHLGISPDPLTFAVPFADSDSAKAIAGTVLASHGFRVVGWTTWTNQSPGPRHIPALVCVLPGMHKRLREIAATPGTTMVKASAVAELLRDFDTLANWA